MYKETPTIEYKITIKAKRDLLFIPISNITHITCNTYLCTIHLLEKKQISIVKTLKKFEKELSDKGFIRINHNVLANIKCINSYSSENRCVSFINNEICSVSTRKIKNLKEFFKN
jgi:DNA-binding LytR/AlgR family response regulator